MKKNTEQRSKDPHNIIGKEIPAADGGNYGHRIWAYDSAKEEYIVEAIQWDNGKPFPCGKQPIRIDVYKITYRYCLEKARDI